MRLVQLSYHRQFLGKKNSVCKLSKIWIIEESILVCHLFISYALFLADSSKTDFGYQNYMGEVSRLLIASPRPRLMEMFILDIFSPSGD